MTDRTPLAKVSGLGSAKSGTRDYRRMKLTSWALIPLSLFVLGLFFALGGQDHAAVVSGLGNPIVALPLFLFILINALHMRLGMQQIIEDYVHTPGLKTAATMGNICFAYGISAAAAFALLKLSFGS